MSLLRRVAAAHTESYAMLVRTESECLRCGEEYFRNFGGRDVFIIRAASVTNYEEPFPVFEPCAHRSHEQILCDECMATQYVANKRGAEVWPHDCSECGLNYRAEEERFIFFVTLGVVQRCDAPGEMFVVETAPVSCTSPDVHVCTECISDHLGASDTYFLLDMVNPFDDDEEEDDDVGHGVVQ